MLFKKFRFSSVNRTLVETNHRWGLLLLEPSLWKASNWKCIFPIGLTLIQWDGCFIDQEAELLPPWLTKQLWMRRWIPLTWCCGAALLLSDYSGARKFCGCHMWSLVWCLYTVPQQWPAATQSTWPKLQPHGQVACVYSNFIPVCLSIIPLTQSGVHPGQGQTVSSPLSLPCPQSTGHSSSLSSTTLLLSGLPLQVPSDNLLEPCCIFFPDLSCFPFALANAETLLPQTLRPTTTGHIYALFWK